MINYKEDKNKNNYLNLLIKKIIQLPFCIKLVIFILYMHLDTRLGAELAILQKKLGIDHEVILKEL
jgi:hypothetical protein